MRVGVALLTMVVSVWAVTQQTVFYDVRIIFIALIDVNLISLQCGALWGSDIALRKEIHDPNDNICDRGGEIKIPFHKGRWTWFLTYGTRCKFFFDRDVSRRHALPLTTRDMRTVVG